MRTRSLSGCAAIAASLLLSVSFASLPASAEIKSYDSSKPSFWLHPPPDWFLGDETESMKGLAPPSGPRDADLTGRPRDVLEEHQAAAGV